MKKLIATSNKETLFFKSMKAAADHFGMALPSLIHYVNKSGRYLKGYRIRSVDGDWSAVTDKGIEGEGTLIHYERRVLECVTPCPFLESPKPKVGSSACMTCKCFEGKDREKQIVRCTHK